jgi:hypothetical protein
MTVKATWLGPALVLVLAASPVASASQEHPAAPDAAADVHEAEARHETEEHHKNHVAGFVGGTHAEELTQGTLGLDYEYRPWRRVGFAVAFEYTGGELREYILAAGVIFHPVGGLSFTLGAGLERRPVEEEHGEEHAVEVASNGAGGGKESLFVARLGITYRIELGHRWSLAPQFNLDFVDDEVVQVFGVSVGFGF